MYIKCIFDVKSNINKTNCKILALCTTDKLYLHLIDEQISSLNFFMNTLIQSFFIALTF